MGLDLSSGYGMDGTRLGGKTGRKVRSAGLIPSSRGIYSPYIHEVYVLKGTIGGADGASKWHLCTCWWAWWCCWHSMIVGAGQRWPLQWSASSMNMSTTHALCPMQLIVSWLWRTVSLVDHNTTHQPWQISAHRTLSLGYRSGLLFDSLNVDPVTWLSLLLCTQAPVFLSSNALTCWVVCCLVCSAFKQCRKVGKRSLQLMPLSWSHSRYDFLLAIPLKVSVEIGDVEVEVGVEVRFRMEPRGTFLGTGCAQTFH